MKADMDFMSIPNDEAGVLTPERRQEIDSLRSEIVAQFPPDISHSKMDVNIPGPFLQKYSAAAKTV